MSSPAAALVAGVLAGLAVAVPLGAVGVLLLQEGLLRGWRSGAAAAGGVASVDLLYAALATVAGRAVARALTGHHRTVELVAGGVIALVAFRGLAGLRDGWSAKRPAVAGAREVGVVAGGAGVRTSPPGAYLRFLTITAVNPLTCLYFVALAAGLAGRLDGVLGRAAFVAGVGTGSLVWQLLLVGVGTGAGTVLGARGRWLTAMVGHLAVLGLAAAVLIG
jgi:threonine/homoserine/homoserine lactone efflux protein